MRCGVRNDFHSPSKFRVEVKNEFHSSDMIIIHHSALQLSINGITFRAVSGPPASNYCPMSFKIWSNAAFKQLTEQLTGKPEEDWEELGRLMQSNPTLAHSTRVPPDVSSDEESDEEVLGLPAAKRSRTGSLETIDLQDAPSEASEPHSEAPSVIDLTGADE